jgi:hypothetical protein
VTDFNAGDSVRVAMPRGVSKRGIPGISVLYTTWPEARFDGAEGTIVDIDPRSKYGIPLYLVDFSAQPTRVSIPWQRQWFRPEWIVPADDRAAPREGAEPALKATASSAELRPRETT